MWTLQKLFHSRDVIKLFVQNKQSDILLLKGRGLCLLCFPSVCHGSNKSQRTQSGGVRAAHTEEVLWNRSDGILQCLLCWCGVLEGSSVKEACYDSWGIIQANCNAGFTVVASGITTAALCC